MKNLGALKYFLGIEVAKNSEGTLICKRVKPANVPMKKNQELALEERSPLADLESYRCLIYLCFIRPELSYSVHVLSQFTNCPQAEHREASLQLVQFLKRKHGQSIYLRSACDLKLYE
uniref:Reverse transcriptase Ty1/copia-type domain-containing protein n=1 Tax=Solanum lycopersicum TaxID=4081 RepID=A0A3Q7JMQ3_SOLLC